MAKQINTSIGGIVKKVSKVRASVGGVVKTVKKGVCGVGGVVKTFFSGLADISQWSYFEDTDTQFISASTVTVDSSGITIHLATTNANKTDGAYLGARIYFDEDLAGKTVKITARRYSNSTNKSRIVCTAKYCEEDTIFNSSAVFTSTWSTNSDSTTYSTRDVSTQYSIHYLYITIMHDYVAADTYFYITSITVDGEEILG